MRFILNKRLRDKVKCDDMRTMTNLDTIQNVIKERCLKLYNNVKQTQHGVAKLCLEGLVEGKRSRGKPKRRWRDNIKIWSKDNTKPNENS